ncbi:hypothetical protein NEOLI_004291 [Neolecta irregularis DAH-3]|uniref:Uncharacterized protein n=1 Tax=Neolecta irregularis (strain DAH-3) TaxID=1198029 RepID=A0A1U7LJ72_NEOID|nr:hypothetical protein NEOLI_004291 [Neolecta irregularis DAH-3]|eukprot:OLL22643.1 hypothetical protein NEOLI_004291 [Neolecta irregularis DAH-3]
MDSGVEAGEGVVGGVSGKASEQAGLQAGAEGLDCVWIAAGVEEDGRDVCESLGDGMLVGGGGGVVDVASISETESRNTGSVVDEEGVDVGQCRGNCVHRGRGNVCCGHGWVVDMDGWWIWMGGGYGWWIRDFFQRWMIGYRRTDDGIQKIEYNRR